MATGNPMLRITVGIGAVRSGDVSNDVSDDVPDDVPDDVLAFDCFIQVYQHCFADCNKRHS